MKFDFDLADVKPSVLSWLIVGLMAVSFILIAKFALNKFYVSGVSEAINAV
jgi:hypothetical protein